MHRMLMKQIHPKNINNCFVAFLPFSSLCTTHIHIHTYTTGHQPKIDNNNNNNKSTFFFLFLLFFLVNTSINCASLYFYSFVDVNFLLFLSFCVCVGCHHIHFFSLAVCSFFFFNCSSYFFLCQWMSCVEQKNQNQKLAYIQQENHMHTK